MVLELQRRDEGLGWGDALSPEELECQICYCCFNLGGRRPRVLACCHRLCTKCLAKLQDLGQSPPGAVVCPFCRCVTRLPGEAVSSLPDDRKLLAGLAVHSRNQRNQRDQRDQRNQRNQRDLQVHTETPELVLSPGRLSSLVSNPRLSSPSSSSSSAASSTTYSSIRSSSNLVLITIMEPPQARGSLDSPVSAAPPRWSGWTWARTLVWVLGLVYASSLPVGMYLLILQQSTLGAALLSLVPASLLLLTAYGLCRCVCRQLRHCWPP